MNLGYSVTNIINPKIHISLPVSRIVTEKIKHKVFNDAGIGSIWFMTWSFSRRKAIEMDDEISS